MSSPCFALDRRNCTLTTSAMFPLIGRWLQATSHLAEFVSSSWVALIPPTSTLVVLAGSAIFAGSTPERSQTQSVAPPPFQVHQCRLVGSGLAAPPRAVDTSESLGRVHGSSSIS